MLRYTARRSQGARYSIVITSMLYIARSALCSPISHRVDERTSTWVWIYAILYGKDAHIHRWPWTESTTVASRYDHRVSPPNTLRLSVYQRSKVDQRAIIAAHTVISIRRISEQRIDGRQTPIPRSLKSHNLVRPYHSMLMLLPLPLSAGASYLIGIEIEVELAFSLAVQSQSKPHKPSSSAFMRLTIPTSPAGSGSGSG